MARCGMFQRRRRSKGRMAVYYSSNVFSFILVTLLYLGRWASGQLVDWYFGRAGSVICMIPLLEQSLL